VKLYQYEALFGLPANRRRVLKGAGAVIALRTAEALGGLSSPAMAQVTLPADEVALRKQILQIPGVGKGSPTDANWQKVGALCLGPTKANVKEGEFKGVELTFMGLNNQNLHNFLFRGFLKPWEAYTGAKINWIDLAQADYNPRLQQAIATGTVDFDILEMGAPFEGDVCGKGLASVMPDWVKKQIDVDDYSDYLKPPVGTWKGKTYRISIDGDCHNFNYRTDYFPIRIWPRRGKPKAMRANGAFPRLGKKFRRQRNSSRARGSRARMPGVTLMLRNPGAGSASISWAAGPPPTPSTRRTKRGCSTSTP